MVMTASSPVYDAAKALRQHSRFAGNVQSLSSTKLGEAGRILLSKGTPSKGVVFRNDPYACTVLESREYPTPQYHRTTKTPTSTRKPQAASKAAAALVKTAALAAAATATNTAAPTTVRACAREQATEDVAVSVSRTASATSSVGGSVTSSMSSAASSESPRPTAPPAQAQRAKKVAGSAASSRGVSPTPSLASSAGRSSARGADRRSADGVACRVLVEFKHGEDVYTSHIASHAAGDVVVVEGDRGHDMGTVVQVLPARGHAVAAVVNVASDKERESLADLREQEVAAARLCQQRVREHRLRMTIEDVEFQSDGGKLTIYYSSNVSVDFRQLQRVLFRDFRCRVWFRTVPASSPENSF